MFGTLTNISRAVYKRQAQYFDDTFAYGIAAQNAMLTTLSTLLRTRVKTPEAALSLIHISAVSSWENRAV